MVHPEEMVSVVNKATGLMTVMYAGVACIGYLAWGALVEGSVVDSMKWCSRDVDGRFPASIRSPGSWACYSSPVCEVPSTSREVCEADPLCNWSGGACGHLYVAHPTVTGMLISIMLIINCSITYVLVLQPVFKPFEAESKLTWKPSVPRTLIMSLTCFSALIVPYFAESIQVMAALTLIAMQMHVPVLMIRGIHHKLNKQIALSDTVWQVTLMVFGTAAMVIGLYSSFLGLRDAVTKNPENLYQITHIFESDFWISK